MLLDTLLVPHQDKKRFYPELEHERAYVTGTTDQFRDDSTYVRDNLCGGLSPKEADAFTMHDRFMDDDFFPAELEPASPFYWKKHISAKRRPHVSFFTDEGKYGQLKRYKCVFNAKGELVKKERVPVRYTPPTFRLDQLKVFTRISGNWLHSECCNRFGDILWQVDKQINPN